MSDSKIPVAILVRVSTVKQETSRQISELKSYADSKGYDVVATEKELASIDELVARQKGDKG